MCSATWPPCMAFERFGVYAERRRLEAVRLSTPRAQWSHRLDERHERACIVMHGERVAQSVLRAGELRLVLLAKGPHGDSAGPPTPCVARGALGARRSLDVEVGAHSGLAPAAPRGALRAGAGGVRRPGGDAAMRHDTDRTPRRCGLTKCVSRGRLDVRFLRIRPRWPYLVTFRGLA